MATRIKWIATRGEYRITRVEHTEVTIPYRGTDGKVYADRPITATRIVGYAGDVAVIGVTVAGTHPMTLANYREAMARKIQDAGGAWMGRSHATETKKADDRIARMYDPKVTPSAADRRALRDAYYGRMPHPSDY